MVLVMAIPGVLVPMTGVYVRYPGAVANIAGGKAATPYPMLSQ